MAMKKIVYLLFTFGLVSIVNSQTVDLELYVSGFSNPVDILTAGDERLFVLEKSGVIQILNSDGTTNTEPFLDIVSIINSEGERGLLGLAFHPDYQNNGYFFVHYSDSSGDTQISRFSVDGSDPDIADPGSELPILNVNQPASNHNGGTIAFGPDGYLYIALGDGGGGGDQDNNAQNLTLMLGKLLRIDIDNPSGNDNYSIPPDNPFAGDPNNAEEIWALGLRNPFRFSFDFTDNKVWIGDVGQNAREEVNSVGVNEAGLNYGWRCYEGNDPYNLANCPPESEMTFPIYDYAWNGGGSVIGGRVYRGSVYTDLQGIYIFGDIDGMIGTLDSTYNFINHPNPSGTWVAFGVDNVGEMYAVSLSGNIYKVVGGQVASIEDFNNNNLKVFPNPSNEFITIQSKTELINAIGIFDINGRLIFSENVTSKQSQTIDVSKFSKGIYLLEITSEKGATAIKKLMVK
jgi:glucose/arabinose dehydrogenase